MNRLIISIFFGLLVVACSLDANPYSDYFIVTFEPGTPEPAAAADDAVVRAIADAKGSSSAHVVIEGVLSEAPGDAAASEMVRRRAAALEGRFRQAGLAGDAIRSDLQAAGGQEFARRKESLIVQVGFGIVPKE